MRLYFVLLFFLIIFSPHVYSQNLLIEERSGNITQSPTINENTDQLFTIKADKSDYNEKDGYVVASGNVFLFSEGTITQADNIFYDLNNEILKIDKPFNIKSTKKEKNEIEDYLKGVSLNYNLNEEIGEAEDVELQIGGIYFKGKGIKFDKNKFTVSNGFFTNCPHKKKHYGMKTRSLIVYLDAGAAVIRGAVLKLGSVPFFYIPNYIYGNAGKSGKSQTVIPEVKNDQVRGVYVAEKMGYHFGNLSNGTFNLEWSKNLGWGGGINNSYKINNNIYGDFRLNYTAKGGFECGIKNSFVLWKNSLQPEKEEVPTLNIKDKSKKKSKKGMFNKFFISFLPSISEGEVKMSVEAGRRELINFRRVSLLPELRLEVTDMLMPFIKSKTSINAGIGNIEEENLLKTKRSFVSFEIKQPILVLKYINLYALLNYDYYKYGQGSMWKKVSGKMDLSGSSKYFDFSLGYLNMFQNTGASPFNFDKYQAVLNDEIYWSAALGKLDSKIGINFYYDLNRKNYRYKEYNFTFKLCKWRFKIMWEAIERNLGVSLALTN